MSASWPDLLDLDRCEHGRHFIDPCIFCPNGASTGNLFLQAGQRIGTNVSGWKIIVPSTQEERLEPPKWLVRI